MQTNVTETDAAQAQPNRAVLNAVGQPEQAMYGRPKLTTPEASKYLREKHGIIITPRTFGNLAWGGRGPKFHKFGGRRYYGPDHLDEWAQEELGEPRKSTSDRPKAGG